MQHYAFVNGSFAVHHIHHLSKRKISAYYNADGELVDAEYIDAEFVSYNIPARHRHIREALQRMPAVYGWRVEQ